MPFDNVPGSIQREYDAAIQRTGQTRALEIAAGRLWLISQLTPEQFEKYSAKLYDKMT